MQAAQVIAFLLPDSPAEVCVDPEFLTDGATALLRDAEGRMTISAVTPDEAFMTQLMSTGCFKRGKAIIDPVSREVMGYEMEMVTHPLEVRTRSVLGL